MSPSEPPMSTLQLETIEESPKSGLLLHLKEFSDSDSENQGLRELDLSGAQFRAPSLLRELLMVAPLVSKVKVCAVERGALEVLVAVSNSRTSLSGKLDLEVYSLDDRHKITATWEERRFASLNVIGWHLDDARATRQLHDLGVESLRIDRLNVSPVSDPQVMSMSPLQVKYMPRTRKENSKLRDLIVVNPNFTGSQLYAGLISWHNLNRADLSVTAESVVEVLSEISNARYKEQENVVATDICLRLYRSYSLMKSSWVKDRMVMLDTRDWVNLDGPKILENRLSEIEILRLDHVWRGIFEDIDESLSARSLSLKELTIMTAVDTTPFVTNMIRDSDSLETVNLAFTSGRARSLIPMLISRRSPSTRAIVDHTLNLSGHKEHFKMSIHRDQIVLIDTTKYLERGTDMPEIFQGYGYEIEYLSVQSLKEIGTNLFLSEESPNMTLRELLVSGDHQSDVDLYFSLLRRLPSLSRLEIVFEKNRVEELLMAVAQLRTENSPELELIINLSPTKPFCRSLWKKGKKLTEVQFSESCPQFIMRLLHVFSTEIRVLKNVSLWTSTDAHAHGFGTLDILLALEELEMTSTLNSPDALQQVLLKARQLKKLTLTIDEEQVLPQWLSLISEYQTRQSGDLDVLVFDPARTNRLSCKWSLGDLVQLDSTDWPSFSSLAEVVRDCGRGLQNLRIELLDNDLLRALVDRANTLNDLCVLEPGFDIRKLERILASSLNFSTLRLCVEQEQCVQAINSILSLRQRLMDITVVFSTPATPEKPWFRMQIQARTRSELMQMTQSRGSRDLLPKFMYNNMLHLLQYGGPWIELLDLEVMTSQVAKVLFSGSGEEKWKMEEISIKPSSEPTAHLTEYLEWMMIVGGKTIRHWNVVLNGPDHGRIFLAMNWFEIKTLKLIDTALDPAITLKAILFSATNAFATTKTNPELHIGLTSFTYHAAQATDPWIWEGLTLLTKYFLSIERLDIWVPATSVDQVVAFLDNGPYVNLRYLRLNGTGFSVHDTQKILNSLAKWWLIPKTVVLQNAKIHRIQFSEAKRLRKNKGLELVSEEVRGPHAVI